MADGAKMVSLSDEVYADLRRAESEFFREPPLAEKRVECAALRHCQVRVPPLPDKVPAGTCLVHHACECPRARCHGGLRPVEAPESFVGWVQVDVGKEADAGERCMQMGRMGEAECGAGTTLALFAVEERVVTGDLTCAGNPKCRRTTLTDGGVLLTQPRL